MGEARRKKSTTMKLISQHPHCCLCGSTRPSTTREHFPPTNFFDNSQRPDSIVVPACNQCNSGTGIADLIAGLISRVGFNPPSELNLKDSRVLLNDLKRRRPDILKGMMGLGTVAKKRGFNELRALGLDIPVGAKAVRVTDEMFQQLHLFCHKAVLCHYFAHTKNALSESGGIIAYLRMKESIAVNELPDNVFEGFGPVMTLRQGKNDFGNHYQYREAFGRDGFYGIAARLRVGFITIGFAIPNLAQVSEEGRDGFLRPSQLMTILQLDRYKWYDQFATREHSVRS
jgi:hypothetical protein